MSSQLLELYFENRKQPYYMVNTSDQLSTTAQGDNCKVDDKVVQNSLI